VVRLRLPLVCLLIASACRSSQGGLEVEVTPSGFHRGCIDVTATDEADSKNTGTAQLPVSEARAYTVGVGLGSWGRKWRLELAAREGSCDGGVAVLLTDEVQIPPGAAIVKHYTLAATDFDNDGWFAVDAGGTDCDDHDPFSAPGLMELCTDGKDNDCKNGADCADPACASKACDDGDGCTVNDVCSGGRCAGAARDCGAPTMACRLDGGTCSAGACSWPLVPVATPCGAGMACRNDGVCVSAMGELNCANGLDDDMDDAGDCADPDCNGAGCDAGPCFTGALCGNGTCGGGAMKRCDAPPSCRDAGSCDPLDGQCVYPRAPVGSACDDGDLCSTAKTCDPGGACSGGLAMACTSASPCLTGSCDAGTCVFAPVVGTVSCDDDAGCTFGDVCTGGTCRGTAYSCSAPPECMQGSACLGDGGCGWSAVANGTGCRDAGYCERGRCETFTYAVANVDPLLFPPGPAVAITCSMTFDSSDGGANTGWCGSPPPNVTLATQRSGEPVAVISTNALRVTDGGVLKLVGSRPVIVLVWDSSDVTRIDGEIDARAALDVAGAGGNPATCGPAAGQNGSALATGNSGASGGGGAGAATAGANGGGGLYMGPFNGADGGAPMNAASQPLRGGCWGGRGGRPSNCSGCDGGAGGGALQISATGALRIEASGVLSVSGGGGGAAVMPGGLQGCGGCGGGSGGVLLLEAATLDVLAGAWLTANGGAGSSGTGSAAGTAGANGSAQSAVPAPGGAGSTYGGNGGNGAAGLSAPIAGTGDQVGGGGGAAPGFVWLRSVGTCAHSGSISPPPGNAGGCP
jgi:hypothetical protein